MNIKSYMTIVDGRVVYEAQPSGASRQSASAE